MPILSADRVAALCEGRVVGDGDAQAGSIVADSRTAGPGAAFAAVRGGHLFVRDALRAGSPFVLVERADALPPRANAVIVRDVVAALGTVAGWVRESLRARVVGITGSTGKTLTRDLLASALAARHKVHAAWGNYNTDVGLPLVLLACPDDTEVVVAELAARRPGEITQLCAICRPHVGVITGVGTAHLEVFGSREAIARTKAELAEAVPPDGLVVAPSDDDFLHVFADATRAPLVTVGPGGETRYRVDGIDPSGRTHGRVMAGDTDVGLVLPLAGRALFLNAAVALRVAIALGVGPAEAAAAMGKVRPSGSRMEIVRIGEWTVVNDAYNANPTSMSSGLRSARELAGSGPVWAVLGEMAELGPAARSEHERIGRLVAALGYEGVVVVGDSAEPIAAAAGDIAFRVSALEDAVRLVDARIGGGAVILVKGSRVTGLDRFPAALRESMAHARQGA